MKKFTLLALLLVGSCATREEIDTILWANTGIKQDICGHLIKVYGEDRISKIGVYRKLADGAFDIIPYCSPEIRRFLSARGDDGNNLLKKHGVKEK